MVSSRHALDEFDVSVFGEKENNKFVIKEKKDWGYFKDDRTGNYLRFKAKGQEELTLSGESQGNHFQCRIPKVLAESEPIDHTFVGFSLAELL